MDLYLLRTDEGYRLHTTRDCADTLDGKLDGNSYDSLTKELLQYVSDGELKVSYSHHLDKEEAAAIYAGMTSSGSFKHAFYTALGVVGFAVTLPILLPTGLSIFFGGFTAYHYLKLKKSKTFRTAELVASGEASTLEDMLNRPDTTLADNPAKGAEREYA